MSKVISLAFDEGRETIATPTVSTMRESQRRIPRKRPRRRTMKTAAVMIYLKSISISNLLCSNIGRTRTRQGLSCVSERDTAYLQLVEKLEVHRVQIAQGDIL